MLHELKMLEARLMDAEDEIRGALVRIAKLTKAIEFTNARITDLVKQVHEGGNNGQSRNMDRGMAQAEAD